MHSFSISSIGKLWIDLIARKGRTFTYAEGQPKGLLQGKKATFLVASGGKYDAGTALASFNFIEPYFRAVFRISRRHPDHFHQCQRNRRTPIRGS